MSIEDWIKDFKGINYDYIQAMILQDGRLQIKTYPISHNTKLITGLLNLCIDDSATVVDMVNMFKRQIMNSGDYMYCLCHNYYDSYISKDPYNIPSVVYPDLNEFIKQWSEYFSKEEARVKRIVLSQHPKLTSFEANEEIEKRMISKTQKENCLFKEAFLKKSIAYIFSVDYDRVKKSIEDSGDILFITNEDYCRTTYSHSINDDVKVTIDTNFCFGSSSFFKLTVNYKGIDLLPYSFWVKYYYARIEELLFCTRKYFPTRDNWGKCLSFACSYINKAIEVPETFVKEDVIEEVNNLLKGLEELGTESDFDIKEKMMVAPPKEGEHVYVGIGCPTKRDVDLCGVYPHEIPLVYRMEKITGALRFLKSLNALAEIQPEINNAINRIKEINANVYPVIVDAIPPMIAEVESIEVLIKKLEKQLKPHQNKYDRLDSILDARLQKRFEKNLSYDEIKETFDKRYPEYEKLKSIISELEGKINIQRIELSQRKRFLDKMTEAKSLIEKYVDIQ